MDFDSPDIIDMQKNWRGVYKMRSSSEPISLKEIATGLGWVLIAFHLLGVGRKFLAFLLSALEVP